MQIKKTFNNEVGRTYKDLKAYIKLAQWGVSVV